MKRGVLIAFLTTALVAVAAQVTLVWDPNSETDLAGYRIYRGTNTGQYDTFFEVHTNLAIAKALLGHTNFFVATAYDTEGLESEFSNEVFVVFPAGNPPSQVQGLELISTDSTYGIP